MSRFDMAHRSGGDAIRRGFAFEIPGLLAAAALNLLVIAVALVCLYPFYLAIAASLKSLAALAGLAHWPATPSLAECLALVADTAGQAFTGHLVNSLAVSLVVVVVSLFLGATADYAFGRTPWRGRYGKLPGLAVSMFPQVAALSGMFELMRVMHLYNHWWGLTLPYVIFTLPFVVWTVMVFAGRAPRRVAGPSWRPALLATGLVAFIAAWNEFMFSLTFVLDSTQRSPPMSVTLVDPPGGALMAGVALAALPVIGLVLVLQRRTTVAATCRTAEA